MVRPPANARAAVGGDELVAGTASGGGGGMSPAMESVSQKFIQMRSTLLACGRKYVPQYYFDISLDDHRICRYLLTFPKNRIMDYRS